MTHVLLLSEKRASSEPVISCLNLLSTSYHQITIDSEPPRIPPNCSLAVIVSCDINSVNNIWSDINNKISTVPVAIALHKPCAQAENYAFKHGFVGVASLNCDIDILVKAFKAMTQGELWYGRAAMERQVSQLLLTRRAATQSSPIAHPLSDRERGIAQ